jgi:hypothetical protein
MQQMLDAIQVGTCGLSAEAGSRRMLQDAGEGISTLLQPLIFGSTLRQQGESGDGESWNSGAAMR